MNQPKTDLHISINPQGWHYFLLGIILTFVALGGVSACYQGRDIARVTGRPVNIDLPADVTSYEQIVTISFHKNDKGETLKDVTYMGADGKIHSKEYNDWGIFQGEIIWNLKAQ